MVTLTNSMNSRRVSSIALAASSALARKSGSPQDSRMPPTMLLQPFYLNRVLTLAKVALSN
jgi:hypothetical protein